MDKKTRGVRNCNPANIRKNTSNKWLGRTFVTTDPSFCQFTSMVYGVRALIVLLRNYVSKFGCKSIKDIICRFAPPSENNTKGYIDRVTAQVNQELSLGLKSTESIPWTLFGSHLQKGDFNFDFLFSLCRSICQVESLYDLDEETFTKAYKMSL